MTTPGALREPPRLVIEVPLEGVPLVRLHAETWEDEGRLLAWARARPRVVELLGDALAAIEREAA